MLENNEDFNPIYCAKCGTCLTYNDGINVVGMTMEIKGLQSDTLGRRIKKQLGDFVPDDVDYFAFHFCHKCFINAYLR
uniref:Uncharacterized protein n=1 Tax=viral metagenome TaxID=1070528 RepID=A0A6M3ISI4_9ZZZZ